MIIRGNRSISRVKGGQHQSMHLKISQLEQENRSLRLDMLKMEQRLLQEQQGKKKYKTKYRQAKQKIEILGLVGMYSNRSSNNYDCCTSPRTKTTRIKTISEEEFNPSKQVFTMSELEDIPTKHNLPENEYYVVQGNRPGQITPNIHRQPETSREEPKLIQQLVKIHEQLDKLSAQIELKSNQSQSVLKMQDQLYKKIDNMLEKVTQMEVRDVERERIRIAHEQERVARKHANSTRAFEKIGKELLEFKVDR